MDLQISAKLREQQKIEAKNFSGLHDKYSCHFCGACAVVCPTKCISVGMPGKEKLYWNKSQCISCGNCFEVCPGIAVDFEQLKKQMEFLDNKKDDLELGTFFKCYLSYAKDDSIRVGGASGGVLTALLVYLLQEKNIDEVILVGEKEDRPWIPYTCITNDIEKIKRSAGSKYVMLSLLTAVKEIEDFNKKYAIVCLPCHIHGLRKILDMKPHLQKKFAYIFGLFCGHNMYYEATEFVRKKLNISYELIKHLKYRGGDWPGGMTFYLKDGTIKGISKRHYNYLNILFLPYRCQFCADFASELADVSFGDIWRKDIFEREGSKKGWSAILSRTKRGEQLISRAAQSGIVYLENLDAESVKICFSYNIKFKQQGIRIRSFFNPYPPRYMNKPLIKNNFCSGAYQLIHYLFILLGQSFLVKKIFYLLPFNLLEHFVSILRPLGGYKAPMKGI